MEEIFQLQRTQRLLHNIIFHKTYLASNTYNNSKYALLTFMAELQNNHTKVFFN